MNDPEIRVVAAVAAPPASLQRQTLSLLAWPITGPLFALIVIFVVFSLTTSTFMNAIRWSNADRLFASLTSMR